MYLIKPYYEILTPIKRDDILQFLEISGRVCYKSEDRITCDSAVKFVGNILKKQHLSVIEHVSVTVKFVIDRGVSHELVRHRLCSYSQESTRYCNYGKKGVTFIIPPWIPLEPGEYTRREDICHNEPYWVWYEAMRIAEEKYLYLLHEGWTPQQARSVLPNSLKTEIITTANLREWRHIFDLRCASTAHPQMQEIMIPLRADFVTVLPEIFSC